MKILCALLKLNLRNYYLHLGNKTLATRILLVLLALALVPANYGALLLNLLAVGTQALTLYPGGDINGFLASTSFILVNTVLYTRQKHCIPSAAWLAQIQTLGVSPRVIAADKIIYLILVTLTPILLLILGAAVAPSDIRIHCLIKVLSLIHLSLVFITCVQSGSSSGLLLSAIMLSLFGFIHSAITTILFNAILFWIEYDLAKIARFSVIKTWDGKIIKQAAQLSLRLPVNNGFQLRIGILLHSHFAFFATNFCAILLLYPLLTKMLFKQPSLIIMGFAFWSAVTTTLILSFMERIQWTHNHLYPYLSSIETPQHRSTQDTAFLLIINTMTLILGGLYLAHQNTALGNHIFLVTCTSPALFFIQKLILKWRSRYRYSLSMICSLVYAASTFLYGP